MYTSVPLLPDSPLPTIQCRKKGDKIGLNQMGVRVKSGRKGQRQ